MKLTIFMATAMLALGSASASSEASQNPAPLPPARIISEVVPVPLPPAKIIPEPRKPICKIRRCRE